MDITLLILHLSFTRRIWNAQLPPHRILCILICSQLYWRMVSQNPTLNSPLSPTTPVKVFRRFSSPISPFIFTALGPYPIYDNPNGAECEALRAKVPTCQSLVSSCYSFDSRFTWYFSFPFHIYILTFDHRIVFPPPFTVMPSFWVQFSLLV